MKWTLFLSTSAVVIDFQNVPDNLFGIFSVFGPQMNLNPAASKAKLCSHQMHIGQGNGGIFNPCIGNHGICNYDNSLIGTINQACTMVFGICQISQCLISLNHHEIARLAVHAGRRKKSGLKNLVQLLPCHRLVIEFPCTSSLFHSNVFRKLDNYMLWCRWWKWYFWKDRYKVKKLNVKWIKVYSPCNENGLIDWNLN